MRRRTAQAHKKPFFWMEPKTYLSEVCEGGRRAALPAAVEALPELHAAVLACWSASPAARPDFAKVVPVADTHPPDTHPPDTPPPDTPPPLRPHAWDTRRGSPPAHPSATPVC